MKVTKISFVVLLLGCGIDSCVTQPEYSVIPHVDLLGITFSRGDIAKGVQDTLTFKLKFKDGDGDLGAAQEDANSLDSSSPWYYFYKPTDFSVVPKTTYSDQIPGYKLINYRVKRTIPQFDTLPTLVCGSWEEERKDGRVTDTVYTFQNRKAYNVNVNVYAKNNAGVYEAYNFTTPNYNWTNCSYNLFRATFPDLSNNRQNALEGVITFRIASYYLYGFFNTETLKMDITVYDRAHHASNIVGKKDFTIAQITK